jgi:hypothetical protein
VCFEFRRSPKDKRIVVDPIREKEIWWGDVNKPIESSSFQILEDTAINYFNTRSRVCYGSKSAVRGGRVRQLGQRVPHQDPRGVHSRLPRAVHAQHADPAHQVIARDRLPLWRRLLHLQRRRVPRQQKHQGRHGHRLSRHQLPTEEDGYFGNAVCR